jgi:hypothetical protein
MHQPGKGALQRALSEYLDDATLVQIGVHGHFGGGRSHDSNSAYEAVKLYVVYDSDMPARALETFSNQERNF